MILALGDFNTRVGRLPGLEGNHSDTNTNFPMFMTFLQEVNLFIMNTLPVSRGLFTRFMGGPKNITSKSLLDYGLIDSDHVNNVCSFVIDENARYSCGSDHALLYCNITFEHRPRMEWKFKV